MKRFAVPMLVVLLASGAAISSAQTSPVSSCVVLTANLAVGSQNNSVTLLQNFLHAQGFLAVEPTGYFGSLTSAGVSEFQKSVGLPAVGVVGPLTRAALEQTTCTRAPQTPPPTTASSTPVSTTTATSSAATSTVSTVSASVAATTTAALPYKAQTFYNWQPVWGQVTVGTTTGILELSGSLGNNGAEAIYPASTGWGDYRYQANVSVANGNISLIGRYADSNNFLACSFSDNWVEIDQTVGGSMTVLASKSVDGILPGADGTMKTTSVAMDVQGNTVGCAGYGPTDNVTATLSAGSSAQGGIGVESWYATPLADQFDLESVEADPL